MCEGRVQSRDSLCDHFIIPHARTGYRAEDAEIGHWIGREFWVRSIVTDAIRATTDYAFSSLLWAFSYLLLLEQELAL
jgi:hypothetical protein